MIAAALALVVWLELALLGALHVGRAVRAADIAEGTDNG